MGAVSMCRKQSRKELGTQVVKWHTEKHCSLDLLLNLAHIRKERKERQPRHNAVSVGEGLRWVASHASQGANKQKRSTNTKRFSAIHAQRSSGREHTRCSAVLLTQPPCAHHSHLSGIQVASTRIVDERHPVDPTFIL